ncbi:hypothetical protein HK405_009721 [Cladochytrium tenue]|nr:hypothetical protein HK405_009721 [Cladochytrium tenue]
MGAIPASVESIVTSPHSGMYPSGRRRSAAAGGPKFGRRAVVNSPLAENQGLLSRPYMGQPGIVEVLRRPSAIADELCGSLSATDHGSASGGSRPASAGSDASSPGGTLTEGSLPPLPPASPSGSYNGSNELSGSPTSRDAAPSLAAAVSLSSASSSLAASAAKMFTRHRGSNGSMSRLSQQASRSIVEEAEEEEGHERAGEDATGEEVGGEGRRRAARVATGSPSSSRRRSLSSPKDDGSGSVGASGLARPGSAGRKWDLQGHRPGSARARASPSSSS